MLTKTHYIFNIVIESHKESSCWTEYSSISVYKITVLSTVKYLGKKINSHLPGI